MWGTLWEELVRGGTAPGRRFGLMALALVAALDSAAAGSALSYRTEERDYKVWGADAAALVAYLENHPFRGDKHAAIANVRPHYDLSVETRETAAGCRVASARLDIRFVMTLPRAMEKDKLSKPTRGNFNSLRNFLKRHESVHRGYYLTCARRFLAKVRKLPAEGSCWSLKWEASRLLDKEDAACDRLHDAFDRRQAEPLWNLALFRQAEREGRRQRSGVLRAFADPLTD
jgi:predicted secreted Zn-dependent protease